MRIVMIGVSHWHTPFYADPVLGMEDATIVGVSDPDASRAAPLAVRAGCPVFTDYREMCATRRPDFAFALGRHRDMAEEARFLIESCIPFAMEKPCAVNAAEAQDIAHRAAMARVFAAVPLVMRYCPLIETIREVAAGERIQYLSFKFVGGMVDRYHQQKVEWVIDRAISGGGPLLNLGIHHIDLCRVLLGNAELAVTGAMMSNRAAGLRIEDHAIMLMQGAGQAAWWRPAISTRRSTRYSTCTTASAPRGTTSRRATTRRSRSSPTTGSAPRGP